jgi:hypothetical protein
MRGLLIMILACPLLLGACKKENAEEMSNVPGITFVSVSSTSVKAFRDSLSFVIAYTDGDGDLGENRAEALNAFIVDPRISYPYELRIPQLAPSGAAVPIKGKITLTLKNTILTDESASQTVNYSIYVKDRAGNKSNTVTSAAVTVSKE